MVTLELLPHPGRVVVRESCPVGTVLGEIEVNGEGPQSTVDSPQEELVDVEFPQMGDSVTEGTVLEWLKQVGDPVQLEERIVEISTDKVDAEAPSPAAGTLAARISAAMMSGRICFRPRIEQC